MKIHKISLLKLKCKVPVYDIEVMKNSNFKIANGPIVHNSKDLADAVGQLVYNCHINMHFFDESLMGSTTVSDTSTSLDEYDQIIENFNKLVRGE